MSDIEMVTVTMIILIITKIKMIIIFLIYEKKREIKW